MAGVSREEEMSALETVWVFVAPNAPFPSAVFSSESAAERWVTSNRLTGLLTEYPLNVSAFDWAVEMGFFSVKRNDHLSPDFIGRFTSAHMAHIHYQDGKRVE